MVAAWSGIVKETPQQVSQRARAAAMAQGLQVKQDIPGQIFMAEGGRIYNTLVLILLVILCIFLIGILILLIYYFTRPKESFTVQIQAAPNGTYVSATANGPKAQAALGNFTAGLSLAEVGGAPAPTI